MGKLFFYFQLSWTLLVIAFGIVGMISVTLTSFFGVGVAVYFWIAVGGSIVVATVIDAIRVYWPVARR
jgi:uncharacterized membrane protein